MSTNRIVDRKSAASVVAAPFMERAKGQTSLAVMTRWMRESRTSSGVEQKVLIPITARQAKRVGDTRKSLTGNKVDPMIGAKS